MTTSTDNLEQALGFNLHIAAFVMKQALKAALKEAGIPLSTEEVVTLLLISDDGSEQSELQQKLYKDKTNITRLLDRLVLKEIVTRRKSEVNRRQQLIELTESGHQTKLAINKILQTFMRQASEDISPENYSATVKSLQQFIQNLS